MVEPIYRIHIEYLGQQIEFETKDERSIEVKKIKETFECKEVNSLGFMKDGELKK